MYLIFDAYAAVEPADVMCVGYCETMEEAESFLEDENCPKFATIQKIEKVQFSGVRHSKLLVVEVLGETSRTRLVYAEGQKLYTWYSQKNPKEPKNGAVFYDRAVDVQEAIANAQQMRELMTESPVMWSLETFNRREWFDSLEAARQGYEKNARILKAWSQDAYELRDTYWGSQLAQRLDPSVAFEQDC